MTTNMKSTFRIFESFQNSVVAGFSDRRYDALRRADFLEELGLLSKQIYLVKQVHGENIVRITADTNPTNAVMADGLITSLKGISIGILTADCVPVFFWDSAKQVIGIAHAGWRGAMHGIAAKMISAFQQNFNSQPENIYVGIGPCIRQSAYEVGSEFEAMFPGFYQASSVQDKGYLDLAGFVKDSLINTGVLAEHIEDCELCTFKEQDHFYSYRRENQTSERILSVISMQGENDESK